MSDERRERSRRSVVLGLTSLAAIPLAGCAAPAPRTLDGAVGDLVAHLDPDGPYRPPTDAERAAARSTLDDVIDAGPRTGAASASAAIGLDLETVTDPSTGRDQILLVSRNTGDRRWGIVAVDRSAAPSVLVEVPHPRSDTGTEDLGLALFRSLPGAVLLIAGAHRRAAGGAADVAHAPDSLFHALATHLADRGLRQVQLHGFHDDSFAQAGLVLSAGAGEPDRFARKAADELAGERFDVCRAWDRRCGSLEGRTNVQGIAAAAADHPFLHVEINRSIRDDRRQSKRVVDTLADVFRR